MVIFESFWSCVW